MEHVDFWVTLALKVAAPLAALVIALYRRDRDVVERVVASAASIWEIVQQERRKGMARANTDPVARGLELAAERLGRDLTAREGRVLAQELAAEHEKRGHPDPVLLPAPGRPAGLSAGIAPAK